MIKIESWTLLIISVILLLHLRTEDLRNDYNRNSITTLEKQMIVLAKAIDDIYQDSDNDNYGCRSVWVD